VVKQLLTPKQNKLTRTYQVVQRGTLNEPTLAQRLADFVRPEPVELGPTERVIISDRVHWYAPIREIGARHLSMSALMMFMAAVSMMLDFLPIPWELQALLWVVAIGHSAWTFRPFAYWWYDLYIVTNKRLIRTGGLIATGMRDYRFNTVNNFYKKTPVLGKILGFHNLRIVQNGGVHDEGAKHEYCQYVTRAVTRAVIAQSLKD
jgi:hypothetical protein